MVFPGDFIISFLLGCGWHHARGVIQQYQEFARCVSLTWLTTISTNDSDILHPNRPNISKDELRGKLAELYKSNKDQVSVFGLRTHYGGGKTTGFALVYDSSEALKKFEPRYRLVRIGAAEKIEKASRQQRALLLCFLIPIQTPY